ncbi:hypothetical protein BDF22DRAFT_741587 [Syncephalis plumigaleata]|nr:hypothetical protein BDF22DRAFT_741587 [Syncephalis plumigaleata]
MPALADLDFFEPEFDDVLFPEALDADYPAPDPGLQWFPELPATEPMFAGAHPTMDLINMPSTGQFGVAPMMMPLTPESDDEGAMSYFSPMPVPVPFDGTIAQQQQQQQQQQLQQISYAQTPDSVTSQQFSSTSPSPAMTTVTSVAASPIQQDGIITMPDSYIYQQYQQQHQQQHQQQQQQQQQHDDVDVNMSSNNSSSSSNSSNNHNIVTTTTIPNAIDASNIGYEFPEASPSLPDLSWSPEALGSPMEELPLFPESHIDGSLLAPISHITMPMIDIPEQGNPDDVTDTTTLALTQQASLLSLAEPTTTTTTTTTTTMVVNNMNPQPMPNSVFTIQQQQQQQPEQQELQSNIYIADSSHTRAISAALTSEYDTCQQISHIPAGAVHLFNSIDRVGQ